MRPRGAANLLVPGRCLGGDHLATSSFRVMGTCAQTGFAAGVAAALRRRHAPSTPWTWRSCAHGCAGPGCASTWPPYYSYLRRRRGYRERAGLAAASISRLAICELPTGEALIAYLAGGTLWMLRRCEERWQPPVEIAAGLADGEDAPTPPLHGDERRSPHAEIPPRPTDGGAGLGLRVCDAGRSRTEGVEEVVSLAAEVAETDLPPEVVLSLGGRTWSSLDGGVSWHRGSGAPNGAGGAVPRPVAGAAVVTLALTDDDRTTLGVPRLHAAAWTTQRGVVLGTAARPGQWRETGVAAPAGSGPCAMTATADGVLLAYLEGGEIQCLRRSLDAVAGDAAALDAGWHHDSAELLVALKEPQPAP